MTTDQEQSPLAPAESPLVEAESNSLDKLFIDRIQVIFNTKPSQLKFPEDAQAIAKYYRAKLGDFLTEEAKKDAEGKKPRAAPKAKIDLSKLEF